MEQPSKSQDLNTIEDALLEEWDRIPQKNTRSLIQSFPKRCQGALERFSGKGTPRKVLISVESIIVLSLNE